MRSCVKKCFLKCSASLLMSDKADSQSKDKPTCVARGLTKKHCPTCDDVLPYSVWHVPVQAWSKFAGRLEDLAQPEKLECALSCLNLLVTDALRHVPDVITYLSRLRNQSVFNFCAIPQVRNVPLVIPKIQWFDLICNVWRDIWTVLQVPPVKI